MKLDKEIRNDYLILKSYGRIDSNTSNEFEQAVQQAIEPGMNIEFDFREVVYISSSGLRVLLTLKKLLGNQINIRFSHVNDVIMDVFEMTGFTDLFEILRVSDDEVPDTRVIFFDIDGTLLSHSTGRIPESTIRAIKKVQETGVKCVIATGRDLVEMEKLPIHDIDFDGYLTLNGNICLDKDKKMFAGNEIAPDEVEVLVNIFKAGKIPFVLIGKEKRYINYVDDVVIQTQLSTHGTIPDIGEYQGEKIYQCLAFVNKEVRRKLDDLLDTCVITSWNDTGIDIVAKTGGKDAGIQKFLDKENITRSQTMAFGDGENDMAMLRFAGIGVAMGNGSDLLKQKADYVTASVDDDGIEKALLHFGLITE